MLKAWRLPANVIFLKRWLSGWVSPGEFIPLAEERGLIHELSDWVLSQGCRYLQAWKAEGRPLPGTLSVNISAEQLDSEELVEHLRHICMPVEPQELTLELTESAMLRDERDRAIVETIVAMARTLGLRTVAEGVETSEHEKGAASNGLRRLPGVLLRSAV